MDGLEGSQSYLEYFFKDLEEPKNLNSCKRNVKRIHQLKDEENSHFQEEHKLTQDTKCHLEIKAFITFLQYLLQDLNGTLRRRNDIFTKKPTSLAKIANILKRMFANGQNQKTKESVCS